VVPGVVLGAGLLVNITPSYGKPEYMKKEKTPCTTCHASAKSKDLNEVGKCYKEKGNKLEGCEAKK
jgi:hypothetical protein